MLLLSLGIDPFLSFEQRDFSLVKAEVKELKKSPNGRLVFYLSCIRTRDFETAIKVKPGKEPLEKILYSYCKFKAGKKISKKSPLKETEDWFYFMHAASHKSKRKLKKFIEKYKKSPFFYEAVDMFLDMNPSQKEMLALLNQVNGRLKAKLLFLLGRNFWPELVKEFPGSVYALKAALKMNSMHVERARVFLKHGLYTKALQTLRASKKKVPLLEAQILLSLGKTKKARTVLLTAPYSSKREFLLWKCAVKDGNIREALKRIRHALSYKKREASIWLVNMFSEGKVSTAVILKNYNRLEKLSAVRAAMILWFRGKRKTALQLLKRKDLRAYLFWKGVKPPPSLSYYSIMKKSFPRIKKRFFPSEKIPFRSLAFIMAGETYAAESELAKKPSLTLARIYKRAGIDFKMIYWASQAFSQGKMTREVLEMMFPLSYFPLVIKYCKEYSLDPLLFLSLIREESKFNPWAISPAGARGLTQIMPFLSRTLSRKLKIPHDPFNPEYSIKMGCYHFAELLKEFNGNVIYALAAYNAGSKRVKKWIRKFKTKNLLLWIELIPIRQTRFYVKKILRSWEVYKFLYPHLTQNF